jgi:hypothetical protein
LEVVLFERWEGSVVETPEDPEERARLEAVLTKALKQSALVRIVGGFNTRGQVIDSMLESKVSDDRAEIEGLVDYAITSLGDFEKMRALLEPSEERMFGDHREATSRVVAVFHQQVLAILGPRATRTRNRRGPRRWSGSDSGSRPSSPRRSSTSRGCSA